MKQEEVIQNVMQEINKFVAIDEVTDPYDGKKYNLGTMQDGTKVKFKIAFKVYLIIPAPKVAPSEEMVE